MSLYTLWGDKLAVIKLPPYLSHPTKARYLRPYAGEVVSSSVANDLAVFPQAASEHRSGFVHCSPGHYGRLGARTKAGLYDAVGELLRRVIRCESLGWFGHAGLYAIRGGPLQIN